MPKNKPLAKVLHFDSFGKRQEKYNRLENSSVNSVEWKELDLKEPYYFFVPKDFEAEEKYMKGFSVNEVFTISNSGLSTDRDNLFVDFEQESLHKRITKLLSNDYDDEFINLYNVQDSSSYNLLSRLNSKFDSKFISKILYRPLDNRYIYYDKSIISRPAEKIMNNMFKNNFMIVFTKQTRNHFLHAQITNNLICRDTITNHSYGFPLYLYPEKTETQLDGETPERVVNFDEEVIAKIEKKLGMKLAASFLGEQRKEFKIGIDTFSPEDLLDYIYAVLHSKSYRETYKEFLKIDFPRVPFDVSKEIFWGLVKLGKQLRTWHLLEHDDLTPNNFITEYPQDGDNLVEKIRFEPLSFSKGEDSGVDLKEDNELGKVFLNDTQYFDGVPKNIWEFYIGGYQPAQKWLKDRKGRNLQYEDILHYGKIILTLSETVRIMEEIEGVFEL